NFPQEADIGRQQSFATLFESLLPNDPIFPEYAFSNPNECSNCQNEKPCKDTYLNVLEKRLLNLMKWRDYDEIHQVKSIINAIAEKHVKSNGIIVPDEILNDFNKKRIKIEKRIKSVFPKVQRWTNI